MPIVTLGTAAVLTQIYSYIVRVLISWIISQLIIFLVGLGVAWLTERFEKEIEQIIRDLNKKITKEIFKVTEFLSAIANDFFVLIDEIFSLLSEKIDQQLIFVSDQLDIILNDLDFFKTLNAWSLEIVNEAGLIIESVAKTICDPIKKIIIQLKIKIDSLKIAIDKTENYINDRNLEIYNNLANSLKAKVKEYNKKINSLFIKLNEFISFFNKSVDEIELKVNKSRDDIRVYNNSLLDKVEAILLFLEQQLSSKVLSPEEVIIIANKISQDLKSELTFKSSSLNINFDKYRIKLELDSKDYHFNFNFDEIDLSFNLPELPKFTFLEDIEKVKSELNQIASIVTTNLKNSLPSFLKSNLSNKVKNFAIIVMVQIILKKKEGILNDIAAIKEKIKIDRENSKKNVVSRTQKVKVDLIKHEKQLIKRLPVVLQPCVDDFIEESKGQILQTKKEIIINIDKIVPVSELDHIIESFPTYIKAELQPVSDAKRFRIADIYRLLCNNFHKSERVALMVYLLSQDVEEKFMKILKK